MFGNAWFGQRFYGDRYFGQGAGGPVEPPVEGQILIPTLARRRRGR
jgi:hypothetical protein